MIQPITEDEFLESWPKDDSGLAAAELLQRLMIWTLANSAMGAECTESRAQAEAAANKVHAKLLNVFSKITVTPKKKTERQPLPSLNRFKSEKPEPEK